MGKCFEKDKDFENATKNFMKAVELNKTSPWAHFRLGWIYIRNGERNKGIEHLKKSLSFDPNNSDVLTKLGEVLMREPTTFDEAEQYLRRALTIDENIPDALVSMGRILEKKNLIDDAMKCYERALKQPVTNINAYYYLGVINEKKKDYKKSI
jgi:tetratricopeptide (TPR) repeat protein